MSDTDKEIKIMETPNNEGVDLQRWVILLFFFLLTGCGNMKKPDVKTTIEWFGGPVFTTEYQGIDPGFYGDNPPLTQFTIEDVEIGLRSDGVVVWKKQAEPPCQANEQ